MARIILGSYMVRYPLGGMMSWVLQYLVGLQQLGHDVYFVEKSGYPDACYNPVRDVMSDDCTYGIGTVATLLERFGLKDRWCFVNEAGNYYGLTQKEVEAIFISADLFLDMGTHGSWLVEAASSGLRVLVDGEPGFTQMKMANKLSTGENLPNYDFYYTVGRNIATDKSTAPTAGKQWHHLFHPVVVDLFSPHPPPGATNAPFTTVMNWQSYQAVAYNGVTYSHKDTEFWKFMHLPQMTVSPLEIAISGKNLPISHLQSAGWYIRNAHDISISYDAFTDYIGTSRGEFSVCKNGYVATTSGWFSDRSAAYLASGRPVVMQETGFSAHLPCGRGLFAIATVEEAAAAIEAINSDYKQHSKWARQIAMEHLDATKVLGKLLGELGI